MPSPKSGKAGTPVTPVDPQTSEEADQADPGQVSQVKAEQRQSQTGKYGSAQTNPYKPPPSSEEPGYPTSWIEVELVDQDGKPVPGEPYSIILPDGEAVADGTLDEQGFVRIEGIDPGTCKVMFPRLDGRDWQRT